MSRGKLAPTEMAASAEATLLKLLAHCRAHQWAGIEPYDVLNSKVVNALPFLDFRLPRLALTQALKRSPINVRPLLLIPNTQNPKALALFLAALLKLSRNGVGDFEADIRALLERIIELRSPGTSYWCWGYSFPWQTRTDLVPRWAPNLVCTTFVADALLDAYEQQLGSQYLNMAVSAAEYVLNELYFTNGSIVGFSYPLPSLHSQTHNANFLGAALLCRIYKLTGEEKFLGPALAAARYSASQQEQDGSWYYGCGRYQRWIDNFHTGFNLSALHIIARCTGSTEFDGRIKQGFEFYRSHFFREDGAVRYFHDRTYPIDTHSVAQAIITLLEFRHFDDSCIPLVQSVYRWAMAHMWDARGFFYYRVLRSCTIRTSYMRWTQSWMVLALATLVCELRAAAPAGAKPDGVAEMAKPAEAAEVLGRAPART